MSGDKRKRKQQQTDQGVGPSKQRLVDEFPKW